MKAEERHRLQENELRRLAEHAQLRAKPFFDRYGTTLLLALAAVLVVVAVVVWWVRSSNADRSVGWDALSAAFRKPNASAEDFADVAELYPGTHAAIWARLYEGELRLSNGIEFLFTDRDVANRELADAKKAFEAALESPVADQEITVRALYGLARALEASSDGDLQPAIERYEQIVADYPGSVYEKPAQERLDALKSPSAKEFYAWFSKQKPAPSLPTDPSRPQDRGMALPGLPASPSGATEPATPAEAPRPAEAASAAPEANAATPEAEEAGGEASMAEASEEPAAAETPE